MPCQSPSSVEGQQSRLSGVLLTATARLRIAATRPLRMDEGGALLTAGTSWAQQDQT
jgi:hypothetical protein